MPLFDPWGSFVHFRVVEARKRAAKQKFSSGRQQETHGYEALHASHDKGTWNRTLLVLVVVTHGVLFTFPFLFRSLSLYRPLPFVPPFLVLNVSSLQPAFASLQSFPFLFSSFVFLSYPWPRSVCSRWMSGRESGVAKLFVGPGPCNRVFDVRQHTRPLGCIMAVNAILDGTGTLFGPFHTSGRPFACILKRVNISWVGVRGQWCDHWPAQTRKEEFSEISVHAGTTQVDLEVERQTPAFSPPGDQLFYCFL